MTLKSRLRIEMYNCTVYFHVTDEPTAEFNSISKRLKIPVEPGFCEGGVIYNDDDIEKYYLIIGSGFLTHNTIVHELYHLVENICKPRSVKEEEAKAWLIGFLAQHLYKFLERKKLKVKNV
jgi:hypothetical protein